jgi:hypothetical protein
MNGKFEALAAGAIIGRASAQQSRHRTLRGKRDPLEGLDPSQRRAALVFGQIVGNVAAAVFLGYELYVFLCVLK